MAFYTDFKFDLKKDTILKTIDCYKDSPIYDSTCDIFYALEKTLKKNVKPLGVYKKRDTFLTSEEELSNQCFCGYYYTNISLGYDVTDKISAFFEEGAYLEGMLFDVMCDHLLFSFSTQLVNYLREVNREQALFLTKRLSPGDDIDFKYARVIVDLLQNSHVYPYRIEVNDAYILKPAKSLTCIYGLSREDNDEVIHHCKICKKPCMFGKVLLDEVLLDERDN